MMTDKKRKMYIFIISISLNLLFFLFAYFLKLPMWLDTTGTIYISFLLYFPAGFIVGLINNVVLSLFFYGFNSIFYYAISISVAFITSLYVKKCKKQSTKFFISLFISILVISVLLSVPITLFVDNGIPSDYWGHYWYFRFVDMGLSKYIATILSVCAIKFIDVAFSILLAHLAYIITPSKIKRSDNIIF